MYFPSRPRSLLQLGLWAALGYLIFHVGNKAFGSSDVKVPSRYSWKPWGSTVRIPVPISEEDSLASEWYASGASSSYRAGDDLDSTSKLRGSMGRLLVPGGAGILGQDIIKQLLKDGYHITIVDIKPVTTEFLAGLLPHASPGIPDFAVSLVSPVNWYSSGHLATSSLVFHQGDVSNTAFVAQVMGQQTYDGVINLAAMSRARGCADNPSQCEMTNINGLINVLAGMDSQLVVPWIIHTSSLEVYGPHHGEEDEKSPKTLLGQTKLAAESILAERYEEMDSKTSTMIIRPSLVYGSVRDYKDRLMPSMLQNALNDLPVQHIAGTQTVFDFIHINDVVETYSRAVHYMQSVTKNKPSGVWTDINLVSGFDLDVGSMVELVRGLAHSSSPIQFYQESDIELGISDWIVPDPKLQNYLGFTPEITILEGITQYIDLTRSLFLDYGYDFLYKKCPESQYGDKSVVREEDIRNRRLDLLDGCTAQIAVKNHDYLHYVKCGGGNGIKDEGDYSDDCVINNEKVKALNWNATIFQIRKVHQKADSHTQARVAIQFEEFETKRLFGFETETGLEASSELNLRLYGVDEIKDSNVVTAFEPRVQHNASYLQLLVAGSEKRLKAVAHSNTSTSLELLDLKNAAQYPLLAAEHDIRLTLLCCNTSEPWPLVMDDYEAADIRYGVDGEIRFDSSKRMHECQKVEQAVERTLEARANFTVEVPTVIGAKHHLASVFNNRIFLPPVLSKKPWDWRTRELPPCMNDCNNPVICVQTGACRCVQADDCASAESWGLTKVVKESKHVPVHENMRLVREINFNDLLLPSARRVIEAHPNFIKVHVVSGYPLEEQIESAECHNLQENHCFSADSILYKAMRLLSVPPDEADLMVLPVYQHCDGAPFVVHDVYRHANLSITDFTNRPKALVLTHDWGVCIHFDWEIWSARTNLRPDGLLDNVIIWSVIGDWVSPCYRPAQDIVIPARTCLSKKLVENFGDLGKVKPSSHRPSLVAWSGTYWGTGKSARMRLVCPRGGKGEEPLHPKMGGMSRWGSWDYMYNLNNAIFCPQPTGIAGWSFRPNDAIYAGCIPVLMSEGSHFPFADILDWSKFSVRISPADLDRVEDILMAIPMSEVEDLQRNLLAVREAFLYSPDESPQDELTRKGPLWFALQSARIRISTQYPTDF